MNTTTGQLQGMVQRLHWVKRWMYRTGHPGALARAANRISAAQFSAGILSPARAVTLEVPGRRTGRLVSLPVVVADYQGGRYLVSMLGNDANWVRNARAAGGLPRCGAASANRCNWRRSSPVTGRPSCGVT